MNATQPHPEATPYAASSLLLATIIIALTLSFFLIEHDIFYTTISQQFGFSEEAIAQVSHGRSEKQGILFLLFLFSIIIFIRRKSEILVFRDFIGCLVLLNIFWIVISFIWADDPALAGKRILLFVILTFTAFTISVNVPLRQFPIIILWITGPILAIGFFAERSLNTWWYGDPSYRFCGTLHPEGQAMNCGMLFLAAATMASTSKGRPLYRLMYLGVMLVAAIFLIMTKCRGPFVGTVIAFGVYKLCTKNRSTLLVYTYTIIALLCVIVLVFGDAFIPMFGVGINLGRQESLSGINGRNELWKELSEYVKERPIFGYGYGSFWTGERLQAITDSQQWRIRSSHSIYLGTVLNLGFIGLLIFLSLVTVTWRRAWQMCMNGGDEGVGFALSLLALWMADGLLSSLVLGNGFVTLLLFMVLFGVSRESQIQSA